MRIAVLILFVPLLLPIFGIVAALPIEAVIYSGLVSGQAKHYLMILQGIVTIVFGLWGTIWVSRKIWTGMEGQDDSEI